MISRLRHVSVGGACAVLLVVGACSASSADFKSTAEDLIEGEIAEQSTFGDLSATCEEPDDPEPGDVFACTGTTEDGRTVEFTATVEDDDKVNVQSTNLITVEGLDAIEVDAVALLERETGRTLGRENFDCGSKPVIIDLAEESLICTITDPATGDLYDAQIEIPSLDEESELTIQAVNWRLRITAEDLIEGEIAEQAALGELSASCEKPDDPEPGDVFACTGTTEDGRTVEFTATVEDDDKVNVESTNLITVEGLDAIEGVAVGMLEEEIGQPIGAENLDCGSEPMIIDVSEETVTCALTDPGNGDVYDTQINIPNLDDVSSWTVQVADAPRG